MSSTVAIDPAQRVVRADGAQWPFSLDLRRGVAVLTAGERSLAVRAQRWVDKRRLARFASLGENFVREQLWATCVDADGPPRDDAERDAAIALSLWLGSGGASEANDLPLDTRLLARVTLDVCRCLGVGPVALDELPAFEVESLWDEVAASREPGTFGSVDPSPFTHRIVVVPDHPPNEPHGSGVESRSAPPGAVAAPLRPAVTTDDEPRDSRSSMGAAPRHAASDPDPREIPVESPPPRGRMARDPAMAPPLAGAVAPAANPPSGNARPAFASRTRSGAAPRFRVAIGAASRAAPPHVAAMIPPCVPSNPAAAAPPEPTQPAAPFMPPFATCAPSPATPSFAPPFTKQATKVPSIDDIADRVMERLHDSSAELGLLGEL